MSENAPTTPETPAGPPRKRRRWLKILLVSVAVPCRMLWTTAGARPKPPRAVGLPYWLTISAATPAACGAAMDVPCRYW